MAAKSLFLLLSTACVVYLLILLVVSKPASGLRQERNGLLNGSSENIVVDHPFARFKQQKYLSNQAKSKSGSKTVLNHLSNVDKENRENGKRMGDSREKFLSQLSESEDHAVAGTLLAFGTLSFLGNLYTIKLIYFQQKHLSPVDIFIVHQAIVELLFTLLNYPLLIIASFNHEWIFGQFVCTTYAIVGQFLRQSSAFSIAAVAIFQYWKVCKVSKYSEITYRTACKDISLVNTFALFWAWLPTIGIENYDVEPFGLSCALKWIAETPVSRLYLNMTIVIFVIIPLVIILNCYVKIFKKTKASETEMENNGSQIPNSMATGENLTCIGVLVAASFIITWIPTNVILWANSFERRLTTSTRTTLIISILAKLSPAWNPFIYIFCTKGYRQAFFRMVKKWIYCNSSDEMEPVINRQLN